MLGYTPLVESRHHDSVTQVERVCCEEVPIARVPGARGQILL